MYETRFTKEQVYDNYAKSVSKPKSYTPAKSRSLGAFEPDPAQRNTTTRSTYTPPTNKKKKKNKGSTYDEVPQVLTQGIVQRPKPKPTKETGYEKVARIFNSAMERFGIFDEPDSTYDTVKPQNIYKSPLFNIPEMVITTLPDMTSTTQMPSPYRPLPDGPDIRNFGTNIGADPSPEKPESAKFDIYDMLNTKEKVMRGSVPGLMPSPVIDQTRPELPINMRDSINRAIAEVYSKEPTYVLQRGDTLSEIAKKVNTTVQELKELNNIEDVDVIYAGDKIKLPEGTTEADITKSKKPKVKPLVLRVTTSGDEDPDAQFYQSFRQGVTPESMMQLTGAGKYESAEGMSELEILARTIEAEASGESKKGKLAVGAVIANRASSMAYGGSIKGAILKQAQFSPWNAYTGWKKGISQAKPMLTEKMAPSKDSYEAAKKILSGDYTDPTDGAVHYLNPRKSKPDWYDDFKEQDRGIIKIGRHEFGNADSNRTYDGRSWINNRVTKSLRPKIRPKGLGAK